MTRTNTDIDIDFADRNAALDLITHIPALQSDNNKHNTGVYFQNIPQDPTTGAATFDSKHAAEYGYFKIDFLNNSIYNDVKSEEHLIELIEREPLWELFEAEDVVSQLSHIHSYFHIVKSIKPKSVNDLAVIIALIRPGKKHLIGLPRKIIDAEIWKPVEGEGYSFKKAHAFAFALSIVVQLNLLVEKYSS